MKISKKDAMQMLAAQIGKKRAGVPVLISDLRKQVPMSNTTFDAAVLALLHSNKYFPSTFAHLLAILTDAEKDAMVPNGKGVISFPSIPRTM
jgi:hypothetical protein